MRSAMRRCGGTSSAMPRRQRFPIRRPCRPLVDAGSCTHDSATCIRHHSRKARDAMAKSTRIQHVVLLMLENRSFDHVFGYHPGVNGLKGDEFNLLKPSAPQSESNPPYRVSNGAPYAVPVGGGPGHSFQDANEQLSGTQAGGRAG